MFPIILCDIEYDGPYYEPISYFERVNIKFNNLPYNKCLRFLRKEIRRHERELKRLKSKGTTLNYGCNKHTIHNELNFLNQKYNNILKDGVK